MHSTTGLRSSHTRALLLGSSMAAALILSVAHASA
jgi:hypothetical protein